VKHYNSLIFDCDGVVLNSNKVKTEAFYRTILPYGEVAAQAMVSYHVANGGVSRYKKFAHFLDQIAPVHSERDVPDLEVLIKAYAGYVQTGLLNCEVATGLKVLREQISIARWFIVSGGDQAELRNVFAQRGIAAWFDGGIFGSPRNKDEILKSEIESGAILLPALFFGDSRYDYQAANSAGLDFIFISGWTEVVDWQKWVSVNQINHQSFI
jgi:phosphoglycolate phosphatase-like HAD superfamily hydrolase